MSERLVIADSIMHSCNDDNRAQILSSIESVKFFAETIGLNVNDHDCRKILLYCKQWQKMNADESIISEDKYMLLPESNPHH